MLIKEKKIKKIMHVAFFFNHDFCENINWNLYLIFHIIVCLLLYIYISHYTHFIIILLIIFELL